MKNDSPSATSDEERVSVPKELLAKLAEVHRGWCNYCKGNPAYCGVGFHCSLRDCEIECAPLSETATIAPVQESWEGYLHDPNKCRHPHVDFGRCTFCDAVITEAAPISSPSAIAAPALPELCKALGWQGGTIHQAVEQTARMRAALQEITRGAGPFNADPLTHADNCIESMKAIATGALEGDWNPE